MINKKIHYCWFGGKDKPVDVCNYIETWKYYFKDYEIIEWNEKNFPIETMPIYAKDAYELGKYAFVSDYVRLYVLYKYGGIYLDTDVEIIKNFSKEILESGFIGFESKSSLCTAVIGAKANSTWLRELLDKYEKRKFIENGKLDVMPNSEYIYEFLLEKGLTFDSNKKHEVISSELIVYNQEYFSPKDFATGTIKITDNTFCIHHYQGTWKNKKQLIIGRISTLVKKIIGEEKHKKLKKLFGR